MPLLSDGLDLRLFLLCFLLSIGTNFFEAFSASYPSSANPSFHVFFNNSYIDRGHSAGVGHLVLKCFWTVSLHVAPFGNLIGCVLGPLCTERYGRRGTLMLANLYGLVASLVSSGAIIFEFPELLILARLVASISATVGLLALILFLQEMPSSVQRGLYSFLCALSISIVECFALCLNMAMPRLGERLLVLVSMPIVPQVVGLLVAQKLMETPQFLLLQNSEKRKDKALKALAFFRKGLSDEEVKIEWERTIVIRTEESEKSSGEERPLWQKIFCGIFGRRERRRALLIGFCTLQITVGGWPILESSTEILSEHFGRLTVEICSFVLVIVYFLSSLTGLFFVERIARRPLVIWSALLNTVSLCLYICFHWSTAHLARWMGWLCLPCIMLYAISLGFALGPLSYFLCAELLPLPCAASAWIVSLVFGANIASTFIFDWVTPPLFRKASAWAFFPLYILPALFCLCPLWLFLPETRAKTKAQILEELNRKKSEENTNNNANTTNENTNNQSQNEQQN